MAGRNLSSVFGEGQRTFLRGPEQEDPDYELKGDPETTLLTDAAMAGINAGRVVWGDNGVSKNDCKTHILLIWERTHRIPRKGENQSKEEHQAATSSIMADFETWCRCEL